MKSPGNPNDSLVVLALLALALGSQFSGAAAGQPEAASDEVATLRAWAQSGFSTAPAEDPPGTWMRLIRQDHGAFYRNKSILGTSLQIGEKGFARGLGTHANSEVLVRTAGEGKEFTAQVGVDNNSDTKGGLGSVVFVVEADGKEVFRSGVCRGGEAPIPVKANLNGAHKVVLRVLDANDGPAHDHADWADAEIALSDGTHVFLDDLPEMTGSPKRIPFSFVYGGKSSHDLLPAWERQEKLDTSKPGRELRIITFTDPATGLEVRAEATLFEGYPAIDWVLYFTNTGKSDSLVLERVLPLDISLGVPEGDVILHRSHGSTMAPTDFVPIDEKVAVNDTVNLAPGGGRSSDGVLPFFNMEWSGGGLVWAVGWSGQWSQQLRRASQNRIEIKAGQQTLKAKLQPGESIRTPRMLLISWHGSDRMFGHNLLRKLILAQYAPRLDGEVIMPPVSQNSFFLFSDGNGTTEDNQLKIIRAMPSLGIDVEWLDAGWFEVGWPNGVGSWIPNATHFPHGLKPLGDEAHKLGLQFLVWFEPERVNPQSRIATEHPEFVLGWKNGKSGDGLFNFGDPAARAWLTDHLSKCITDWGIDIYRTDFNFPPLSYWQNNDTSERQGITENHYISGLYAMWDELRRRHPRLAFDDCASGGRRIDLEMMSRSYALSRSDTICDSKFTPAWDQAQTAGLSLFVPVNGTLSTCGLKGLPVEKSSTSKLDLYGLRSAATSGLGVCQNTSGKDFPTALLKQVIAEVKQLRPLYNGDYYPLTPINVNDDVWCAWQFDRPDLGRGFAMFFRRPNAAQTSFKAALYGIDPKADYKVTFPDRDTTQTLSGADLMKLNVEIQVAPGSLLVMYSKVNR